MKKLNPLTLNTVFVILICVFSNVTTLFGQVKKTFTPRYSESIRGDYTMIANNMLSRDATSDYTGEEGNHDFTDNVFVDIDSDDNTFNSSNATFNSPKGNISCITIKKAFLYWAAADAEESDPSDEPNWNFNQVKIMLPGSATYTTITADEVLYRGRDDNGDGVTDDHFSNDPYICFKDITNDVIGLTNPYGIYQIANVRAKEMELTGHDGGTVGTSGGWQIVFVYDSPIFKAKNITIFDGYAHVTQTLNTFNINFNGFQTVPNGNVKSKVLIGALEGDRDLLQDKLQIFDTSSNWVDLSTSLRDADNFFNSKITLDGSDFTDRVPASTNTLGFDAGIFDLNNNGNNLIDNNQTSATIRLTSDQETYGLYLLGLSVEVYEPNLSPLSLFTNVAGGGTANASDVVDFSIFLENNGNDDIINLEMTTTLPSQVTLVDPIVGLPAGVTYTYDITSGVLTFFVQDGNANAGAPGYSLNYQLLINDHCYFLETECATSFNIQMTATYNGAINNTPVTTLSSSGVDKCGMGNQQPNKTIINQPPLVDWLTVANDLDRTIECGNASSLADAQNLAPILEDCNLTLTKTSGPYFPDDFSCISEGTYTNTWNYSDICGRSGTTYTQVITIQDTTSPTFIESLPSDVTVTCDNIPTAATLTVDDTCDSGASVTFNETISDQDNVCDNNYIITREWTATDCIGNTLTHTQIITVSSITGPIIDSNAFDFTVQCGPDNNDALNNWLASNGSADAYTECGSVTWTNDFSGLSDECGATGSATVTFTATDACGNTATTTATFTIEDTVGPTINGFPSGVNNNQPSCINAPVLAFDNYTEITGDGDNSTFLAGEVFQVNNVATNLNALITIVAIVNAGIPELDDNSSGPNAFKPRTSFNITNTGDDAYVEYRIDFVDTTTGLPSALPEFYTNFNDIDGNTDYSEKNWTEFTTSYTVNTPTELTVVDQASWTVATGGTTEYTGSTNANPQVNITTLNTNSASFTFRVGAVAHVDNVSATGRQHNIEFSCIANYITPQTITEEITLECSDLQDAETLTATDACGNANVTFNEVRTDGSCENEYTLERTWTATDDCGNTTVRTLTINVIDTTAPTFTSTLPTDETVSCDAVPTIPTITAVDNCNTPTPVVVTVTETSNADASGCDFTYELTRIWTATDACGLTTSHTQVITVEDNEAPTFDPASLPADVTVNCEDSIPALNTITLVAQDNCASVADITITANEVITGQDDDCPNTYSIDRTWTASDCNNNTVTHTQTINVIDDTAPVITTSIDPFITVSCMELPDLPEVEATDNCSAESEITITHTETVNVIDDNNYDIIWVWNVSDECGNTNIVQQVIHVIVPVLDTDDASLCITDEIIDLYTLVSSNYNGLGYFEVTSGNYMLTDEFFDPTNAPIGDYVITFYSDDDCDLTGEININVNDDCIDCFSDLVVSKVVTPNGDGFNDYFKVEGINCGIPSVKMFNRWGTLVFEDPYYQANKDGGWYGQSQSNLTINPDKGLGTGTYYYIIELPDTDIKPFTGQVYLGTK